MQKLQNRFSRKNILVFGMTTGEEVLETSSQVRPLTPQNTQPLLQGPHDVAQQQCQTQLRPSGARYHSSRQNRPIPAYKLQAKVTALERSGRKDPVIRFDVYVGVRPMPTEEVTLTVTDESTKVQDHTISRRTQNAFRICQALRAFDLLEPGSHGSCGAF